LSPKNGPLGQRPGPGKDGQNNAKKTYLLRSPQKTNPKRKMFFLMSTRRLAESVEGLNSSLALAAGDLWPKKGVPVCWRVRSLKGQATIYQKIKNTPNFNEHLTSNPMPVPRFYITRNLQDYRYTRNLQTKLSALLRKKT